MTTRFIFSTVTSPSASAASIASTESSKVGLRKPDPRIYHLTCERLEVQPAEAAFLDDIGANLKSARALGMLTIKVEEAEAAIEELGRELGLDLLT